MRFKYFHFHSNHPLEIQQAALRRLGESFVGFFYFSIRDISAVQPHPINSLDRLTWLEGEWLQSRPSHTQKTVMTEGPAVREAAIALVFENGRPGNIIGAVKPRREVGPGERQQVCVLGLSAAGGSNDRSLEWSEAEAEAAVAFLFGRGADYLDRFLQGLPGEAYIQGAA